MNFEKKLTISTSSIRKIKKPGHLSIGIHDITLGSPAIFSSRDIFQKKVSKRIKTRSFPSPDCSGFGFVLDA